MTAQQFEGERRPVPRSAFVAVAISLGLNGFIMASWVSRIPATRDRLAADPRTIGLVLLMSGLGAIVAMPLAGRIAARIGSGPVLAASATAGSILLIGSALTPTAVTTGGLLILMGAALGTFDVCASIQGSYLDRSAGRDYMPRYHACWSLGAILGAGVGALAAAGDLSLATHFSMVALFITAAALITATRWYLDDRPVREPTLTDGVAIPRARMLTKRLLLIGLLVLLSMLLEGAAADWLALYLHDFRNQTQSLAALGYATFALAVTLTRLGGTTVIDRLGRAQAIRLAGLFAALGITITLLAPAFLGSLIGVALWGMGLALVFPAGMSAAGERRGHSAAAIAYVATVGYGGFLVGPPLIGLIAQTTGLANALWVLLPLALSMTLLAPVIAPSHHEVDSPID